MVKAPARAGPAHAAGEAAKNGLRSVSRQIGGRFFVGDFTSVMSRNAWAGAFTILELADRRPPLAIYLIVSCGIIQHTKTERSILPNWQGCVVSAEPRHTSI